MSAIYKRELRAYYHSMIGWVFTAAMLILVGIYFMAYNMYQGYVYFSYALASACNMLMLLVPVLTMRSMSEERASRTDQLLLTSPVSLTGVVLGKYFAAVAVMLLTTLLTMLFVGVIALYGAVYPGEMLVGYLGFILQGCAFIALDLCVSGYAGNQVTAVVLAFGVNFALWMLDILATAVQLPWLSGVMSFLSLYTRQEPFLMGQLSFASIGFDVTFVIACLLLTIHALDARRYRGG